MLLANLFETSNLQAIGLGTSFSLKFSNGLLIQNVHASYSATSNQQANGKGTCPVPFKDNKWSIFPASLIGSPRHYMASIWATPLSNDTFDIAAYPVSSGATHFLCIGFWK